MEKTDILNRIKDYYRFKSISEFARFLGINSQNIRNWYKRGNYNANLLIEKCKEIRPEFIITGEGEMLKKVQDAASSPLAAEPRQSSPASVPLLPIAAAAGHLNDFEPGISDEDCERIISPIKGVQLALKVSGESMSPEIPNGSYIFIRRIDERMFIEWGRVYVLDTENGVVIKRLAPSDKGEGWVKCLSDNPDPVYAPFDVDLSGVRGVWRVLMCMSMK